MTHLKRLAATLAVAALPLFAAGMVQAQSGCAPDAHRVAQGETIFTIAQARYGDPEKWTLIYYANEAALTASVFQVKPGDMLIIPCEAGSQEADATPLRQDENAEMKLLTGSDFAPFTDRTWQGQGLVTELVNAAMEATPDPVTYSITWEDDWSQHLFPKLDRKEFDMGFPWYKPDCDATPNNERCANFHFSDPLVEVLVLLFVKQGSGFVYESDADIPGKTLCRPKGYFTHDLDRAGREWISKGLITLVQADTPQACFEQLQAGTVDAVTVNVFLGAETIDKMGLRGAVVPLEKPLSSEGLHVIISKKHWRGTTFLYRFNAGLAALKESERYNEIVSKHLGIFWDRMKVN
ncbi:transporter substrate-binding domain-containing protein [Tropicibacter oceani]|uniref:Transporter substrate-binding domain-containing protein n=1 Tax=Tropicibacter oceani TaxID=3058420 RepID=A0ABY8QM90_9RHOB|nr:transporter substrate-binding domain-containing protein [Tropicibacter oceani]WGW05759.1 transporter substrate-binding domain-containing protein [Tropicibacter oceani]